MASRILIRKSGVAGVAPQAANLEFGELAINYADGKLFYKDATNTIKDIALDSSEIRDFIQGADLDMGTNKILYSNTYATTGDLPAAASYTGMFAQVTATGFGYYSNGTEWVQLTDTNTPVSTFANDANYLDSARARSYIEGSDLDLGTNKILFSNVYATLGDLPSATDYHGMFAHVHAEGKAYFAHAGNWVEISNASDLTALDNSLAAVAKSGAYADLSGVPTNVSQFANDANYLDSAAAQALITGDGFATQTYVNTAVDSAISGLIDAAPGTLDTLNELAAALGDDANFSTTITNLISEKVDSAQAIAAVTGANISLSNFDNTTTNYKDSAEVVSLIDFYVDSAFISEHIPVLDAGVFDSFTVLGIVDSDYVAQLSGGSTDFANFSSSIIPDTDLAYDLGSPTKQWRDIYVGPGSLYVNGQKVIEDNSGTITVTADQDQSLAVKTFGTGQTTVQSEAGVNLTTAFGTGDISLTTSANGQIELNGNIQIAGTATINSATSADITFGDNIDMNLNRVVNLATPQNDNDAATKAYVDANGGGGAAGTDSATVQAMIDTSITALVDGAPTALDTLNELAVALQNDSDALAVLTLAVNEKVTSSDVTTLIDADYIQARQNNTLANVQLSDFEFTATTGQTVFSGADNSANSLAYASGNMLVHLNGILLKDGADYTATDGSTITLTVAADSADILTINSFTSYAPYSASSVSVTAEANKKYVIDASAGAVTVTLPSNPSFGDEVRVIDGTGSAATNNITVTTTDKILASDDDFVIDIDRAAVEFVYYNTTQGWIISSNS